MEPMKFCQTYEVVTDESAEQGEAEETGFDLEDEPFTFRELVDYLNRNYIGAEPSERRGVPRWITSHGDRDFRSGDVRSISLHPANDRARRWWPHALRAAGLLREALSPTQKIKG